MPSSPTAPVSCCHRKCHTLLLRPLFIFKFYPSALKWHSDGLCAVFHSKLGQNRCNVILYGLMADSEQGSNFLIALPSTTRVSTSISRSERGGRGFRVAVRRRANRAGVPASERNSLAHHFIRHEVISFHHLEDQMVRCRLISLVQ